MPVPNSAHYPPLVATSLRTECQDGCPVTEEEHPELSWIPVEAGPVTSSPQHNQPPLPHRHASSALVPELDTLAPKEGQEWQATIDGAVRIFPPYTSDGSDDGAAAAAPGDEAAGGFVLVDPPADAAGAEDGIAPAGSTTACKRGRSGVAGSPQHGTEHPVGGWGRRQSGYHIQVATSLEGLMAGKADLWDTGKVDGGQTLAVAYQGAAMAAGRPPLAACQWRVRLWDERGVAGPWSEPAAWRAALQRTDWAPARWVVHPAEQQQQQQEELDRLEGPSRRPRRAPGLPFVVDPMVLPPAAYFRHAFEVQGRPAPAAAVGAGGGGAGGGGVGIGVGPKRVRRALLSITANGIYRATLDGRLVSDDRLAPGWTDYSLRLHYQTYDVTDLLLPPAAAPAAEAEAGEGQGCGSRHVLGVVVADGWYAGYIGWQGQRNHYGLARRLLARLQVEYDDGSWAVAAASGSGEWQVSLEGPVREADLLMGEEYDATREDPGWDRPAASPRSGPGAAAGTGGAAQERQQAAPASGGSMAGWVAAAVDPLDPEGPDPRVAPLLQASACPLVRVLCEVPCAQITSPAPGVWLFNLGQNIAGVVRLKVRGAARGQRLVLRYGERLQPDGTLYTANLRSARATDTYVCRGPPGGAAAADGGCSGGDAGEEVWQPLFTFHGFQYVEVTGYPGTPPLDAVVGLPLSSALPRHGSLWTSDPRVNALLSNIYWTQRDNFLDVPTDCPQRDERLGWTGDAQIYIPTASMLCDVQPFFRKWLVDLVDAQADYGSLPMFAPLAQLFKVLDQKYSTAQDGGPAWADAGVICPSALLLFYGDTRALARTYPALCAYVDWAVGRCEPGLRAPIAFHCFGDWLNDNDDTPKDLILRAYLIHSLDLTAAAAGLLQRTDDAARYSQLAEQGRSSYCQDYLDEQEQLLPGSQCAAVLSLSFDLLKNNPRARERAAERLARLVSERKGHLSTGFVGTRDLMRVLSASGYVSSAYGLLACRTYPSWGFTLDHGATTMWERWDGWTPERGFQDPGMNSFCHYSFGAVGQWLFESVGGIRPLAPGFERVLIAPLPDPAAVAAAAAAGAVAGEREEEGDVEVVEVVGGHGEGGVGGWRDGGGGGEAGREAREGVSWAVARYRSCRGDIEVAWRIKGGSFHLDVSIPVNVAATVLLPAQPEGLLPPGVLSVGHIEVPAAATAAAAADAAAAATRAGSREGGSNSNSFDSGLSAVAAAASAAAGLAEWSGAGAQAAAAAASRAGCWSVMVGSGRYSFEVKL